MHDINKIREDFSAAAASYDRAAEVQHIVASRLTELAMPRIKPAARVLDIGAGTGFLAGLGKKDIGWTMLDLSQEMLKRARDKGINGGYVVADAQALPFADGVFDAAMSSLAFQWLNDRRKLIDEVKRVMRAGGVFAFATLGAQTLHELRQSFAYADPDKARVNSFVSMDEWQSDLAVADFRLIEYVDEIRLQHFCSMEDIISSLRAVGATHKDAGRPKNMTGRERFAKAEEFYAANFSDNGRFRLSWQPLYFVAEKQSS